MKYDSDYHSAVVSNLRRGFLERYEFECELLSDEEIWNIHQEWGNVEDPENPFDRDFCTYYAMREAHAEK